MTPCFFFSDLPKLGVSTISREGTWRRRTREKEEAWVSPCLPQTPRSWKGVASKQDAQKRPDSPEPETQREGDLNQSLNSPSATEEREKIPLPMLILRNLALGNLREWHAFLKRQKIHFFWEQGSIQAGSSISLGSLKPPKKIITPQKCSLKKNCYGPLKKKSVILSPFSKHFFSSIKCSIECKSWWGQSGEEQ